MPRERQCLCLARLQRHHQLESGTAFSQVRPTKRGSNFPSLRELQRATTNSKAVLPTVQSGGPTSSARQRRVLLRWPRPRTFDLSRERVHHEPGRDQQENGREGAQDGGSADAEREPRADLRADDGAGGESARPRPGRRSGGGRRSPGGRSSPQARSGHRQTGWWPWRCGRGTAG